jgi:hypothetical protein
LHTIETINKEVLKLSEDSENWYDDVRKIHNQGDKIIAKFDKLSKFCTEPKAVREIRSVNYAEDIEESKQQ